MSRVTDPIEDVLDEWGGTDDAVDVLTAWRREIDAGLTEARRLLRAERAEQRKRERA